ncbi:Golgi phosphoprotein 3 GPP34 [Kineococcus xinjiangensis]|uniref:Golgi phosphoprotein 3 GPP34 n=1 Tax=Kineococcus xinjiangensis TaxID=512762 RepID=A0A2S6ICD8_9ACTN|nr:GPP34 family phosphoprotein [Kineococcus xinjiangensis]PPK90896.1 Golgi phosphoprotein 3 GPP34 [Kineococcus xinjiangensis]
MDTPCRSDATAAQPRRLAEDLLLLLLDPAGGRPLTDSTRLDLALAGAVLVELAEGGRVDVAGADAGWLYRGSLLALEGPASGDEVLDGAWRLVRGKPGLRPASALNRLQRRLRPRLLERMAARGEVVARTELVLGLIPRTRWVPDAAVRATLHARLSAVLVGAEPGSGRSGALLSLLHSVSLVPKVFAATGLPRAELKRRAAALAEGDWASEAVRRAVRDVQTATTAAMTASVAAAATAAAS